MGYSCECYALRELIGPGRKEVASEIIESAEDLFNGSEPEEGWRPALPPVDATDAEALAVVAMVRFLGDQVGELGYTSRGGNLFRAVFDPAFQPQQFEVPALAPLLLLLGRPLAGLIHSDYPTWAAGRAPNSGPRSAAGSCRRQRPRTGDQAEWLQALADILLDVQDGKTDLVTLFV